MSKSKQGKKSKEGSGGLEVAETTQDGWPARVMEIIGKIGTKQVGTQVRCKILDGKDSGKIVRRNVLGPIRINDILMLKQTEIEASPLKGGRR